MLSAVNSAGSPSIPEPDPGLRRRPPVRQIGLVAALLAGSWLVSVLATVIHADWLLLIVMLVATAGVLRAGDALLDRLMLALTLMLGALLALGLVYSVWPWHLDPIGISGSYLTLLVLAGAATGRSFRIPRKARPTDLILLAVPVIAFAKLYAPIARLSPIQRFGYNSPIEDEFSHFAYYDAIHSIGGYGFLNSSKTFPYLGHPAEKIYPQGAHFLYVLLDVFTRSSTTGGGAVAEYNRFFILTMVGFAFLVLVAGWTARWIAGPLMTGWRSALVCAAVSCFAAFGPFGFVFRTSDVAEVIGLAFLGLLFAVTMRAPRQFPDQLLITAAALIGVSFAYYEFLAVAAPILLVGVVAYRRRLREHWLFTAVIAVLGGLVVAVPLVMLETATFSVQAQVGAKGAKATIDRPLLALLVLIVLAGQATRAGRRLPTWRILAVTLGITTIEVIAAIYLQGGTLLHASYYTEKLVYALLLMCLASFGAVTLLLKRPPEAAGASGLKQLGDALRRRAPGPVLALAVVALIGLSVHGIGKPSVDKPFWLAEWAGGQVTDPDEPVISALGQRGLLTSGADILVATSDYGYYDYRLSLLIGDLNHHEASINLLGAGTYVEIDGINQAADDQDTGKLAANLKVLLGSVTPGSGPVDVVVADPKVAAAIADYQTAHPGLQLNVVVLPAQYAAPIPS
jgi:hypothetical protein